MRIVLRKDHFWVESSQRLWLWPWIKLRLRHQLQTLAPALDQAPALALAPDSGSSPGSSSGSGTSSRLWLQPWIKHRLRHQLQTLAPALDQAPVPALDQAPAPALPRDFGSSSCSSYGSNSCSGSWCTSDNKKNVSQSTSLKKASTGNLFILGLSNFEQEQNYLFQEFCLKFAIFFSVSSSWVEPEPPLRLGFGFAQKKRLLQKTSSLAPLKKGPLKGLVSGSKNIR